MTNPDWVARGIAIGGCAGGVGALGWNIFAFGRTGPRLKVTATVAGRRAEMTISGRVRNVGRLEATLDRVEISWEPPARQSGWAILNRPIKVEVPNDHLGSISLRDRIGAQHGMEYGVVDIDGVDPGLYAALHDRRAASVRFVTASGSRAKARIKYKKR